MTCSPGPKAYAFMTMTIIRGPARPDLLREEVLADIFETTAQQRPEHLALIYGTERITYRELDERSSLMAHHLIVRGVRAGDIIGLWLPRGIDLLVGQLAIAKAGAAWLPFDADVPVERVVVCMEDAKAVGILTHDGWMASANPNVGQIWTPGC